MAADRRQIRARPCRVGRVWGTGDLPRPFVVLDENGAEVRVVSEFLHHMLADDARPSSLRSYAH